MDILTSDDDTELLAMRKRLTQAKAESKKAAQAVLVTFFFGECIIAVELRITEEFSSANLLAVSHKSFFIKNSAGYTMVRAVIKVCRAPGTLSPRSRKNAF